MDPDSNTAHVRENQMLIKFKATPFIETDDMLEILLLWWPPVGPDRRQADWRLKTNRSLKTSGNKWENTCTRIATFHNSLIAMNPLFLSLNMRSRALFNTAIRMIASNFVKMITERNERIERNEEMKKWEKWRSGRIQEMKKWRIEEIRELSEIKKWRSERNARIEKNEQLIEMREWENWKRSQLIFHAFPTRQ